MGYLLGRIHGMLRRWSGKLQIRLQNTATLVQNYHWSIAGPTTTVCQALSPTSYRKIWHHMKSNTPNGYQGERL